MKTESSKFLFVKRSLACRRRSVIAQGNGYYGVGLFTTDLSWEKLILALLDEPGLIIAQDIINTGSCYRVAKVLETVEFDKPSPLKSVSDKELIAEVLRRKLVVPECDARGGA